MFWGQRQNIGDFRWGGSDIATDLLINDPMLDVLVPGRQASFKGAMMRMAEPIPPMQRAMIYFPEGSREPFPCVSMGEQGKGRVVYFAAGLDAAYFSYSLPWQRVVLARAIQWAAKTPHAVEVQAPMCVQATFWKQQDKDGQRRIVHLWNGLNTTAGHGAQEMEVPLREEAVAIHGIELRISGPAPARVLAQPGNLPVGIRTEAGTTILSVPPLAVHLAVVMEDPPADGR